MHHSKGGNRSGNAANLQLVNSNSVAQNSDMSSDKEQGLGPQLGFEQQLVDRYTARLLDLARRQLPDRVRKRVDPEDLVQSVYRSFFQRLKEGRFSFADSGDLWRLLAAMTFQRVMKAIRFHQQQCRDVRREEPLGTETSNVSRHTPYNIVAGHEPGPDDLVELFDSLEKLLSNLPDKYRDIAVLQLQGFSIDEIAQRVSRSRRTVFRAISELQSLAQKLLGEPA
jgi:RNA polymerase sigma factor (sigma-70 family)